MNRMDLFNKLDYFDEISKDKFLDFFIIHAGSPDLLAKAQAKAEEIAADQIAREKPYN